MMFFELWYYHTWESMYSSNKLVLFWAEQDLTVFDLVVSNLTFQIHSNIEFFGCCHDIVLVEPCWLNAHSAPDVEFCYYHTHNHQSWTLSLAFSNIITPCLCGTRINCQNIIPIYLDKPEICVGLKSTCCMCSFMLQTQAWWSLSAWNGVCSTTWKWILQTRPSQNGATRRLPSIYNQLQSRTKLGKQAHLKPQAKPK